MTAAKRLRWTIIIITIGCLASMAISHRLWLGAGRSFPRVPVVSSLPVLGWHSEAMLTVAFAAAIVGAAALGGRWGMRLIWLAVALGFVLMLFDQMRMQPWFLQYLLMWMVLGSRSPRKREADDVLALRTVRLIVSFMYIFSGLHKINASFFAETSRLMLQPVADLLPAGVPVNALGYLIPALEVFIGFGLLFTPTRKAAMIAAVAMHTGILILIGPLGIGHNVVVWPWNITMIGLLVVLYAWRDLLAPATRPSRGCLWMHRTAIVLAGVVPIAGLLGWIDVYLSWGMYAGAPPLAALEMSPAMVRRLPEGIQKQVVTRPGGTKAIFIQDWSFADLQVVYPEQRIIRAVAREILPYVQAPDELYLHVIPRPGRWTNDRVRVTVPLEELSQP